MEYPLISVLVPVYNVEKYLRQCLDSIVNQTYKNIEVVCVDDASTDNSLAILNEYAQKDERIIVLQNATNKGIGLSRKILFENSVGQHIIYIDSDDWIENNMLELLISAVQSNSYDLCYCYFFRYDAMGKMVSVENFPLAYCGDDKIQRIKYNILSEGKHWRVTNKLVNRKIYQNVFFPEVRGGVEDIFISCQLYYYANKMGCVSLPLYHYRYNEGSVTKSSDNALALLRRIDIQTIYKMCFEFIEKNFKEDEIKLFEPQISEKMSCYKQIKPECLEILKDSKLPIYLYGAGELSAIFCQLALTIAGIVVSKEYFKEGSTFFGHSVQLLEEVLNEKSEANVILCFLKDSYDDTIETLKKIAPNCNFLITQKMFLEDLQGKIEGGYC